ncbi:MAG: DUF3098 domain-containing protein [Prevotella sp.]|nr:DUF3098 domain-containing protein [Prevotella sp.]
MGKRNAVDKRNLAFGKTNFILLAISAIIVVIGFILMSGPGSSVEKYNPDIFGSMRVTVAPIICFLGFISMIVGVMYRKKDSEMNDDDFSE